jgi:hypothetical protein
MEPDRRIDDIAGPREDRSVRDQTRRIVSALRTRPRLARTVGFLVAALVLAVDHFQLTPPGWSSLPTLLKVLVYVASVAGAMLLIGWLARAGAADRGRSQR